MEGRTACEGTLVRLAGHSEIIEGSAAAAAAAAAAGAARCCCVLVCGLCSAVRGLEGEHKGPSADDCVGERAD